MNMKSTLKNVMTAINTMLVVAAMTIGFQPAPTLASGSSGGGGTSGGGGSTVKADSIKVSKCFYDAPTGEMLIKASSSDPTARLFAYRPDGTYQGEVQNGGGSRYGGTVMGWIASDPTYMVIVSSSGGVIQVPTTPFQI
jgi:hypothetical protein